MSFKEIPDPADYLDRMSQFILVNSERGVNNFIIQGPLENTPLKLEVLAGLFPPPNPRSAESLVIAGELPPSLAVASYHSRILHLHLPDHVLQDEFADDAYVQAQLKAHCQANFFPYIVIGFGHQKVSQIPVVLLSSVVGLSPQKALWKIQSKSREYLARLN